MGCRHYFNKGEPRTLQIHMYDQGSLFLQDQLKFRDLLRKHEHTRIEYEQLKLTLSNQHKHAKHEYAEAKTEFVNSVLRR